MIYLETFVERVTSIVQVEQTKKNKSSRSPFYALKENRGFSVKFGEISSLTRELVEFPSCGGNKKEIGDCLQYIKDYFAGCPVIIKEFEHGGKQSTVISFEDKKEFKVLLHGHIDVVSAEPGQFVAVEKDDKLFGRGAVDAKGGVAALLSVFRELSFSSKKPDAALFIVSDEETGGENGTKFLLEDAGYNFKFAISAEPNQSDNDAGLDITVGHKGLIWLSMLVSGKPSHASRPYLGNNAIEAAYSLYSFIKNEFNLASKDDPWNPSVIATQFRNLGNSKNTVPGEAEIFLDIRYTDPGTVDKILHYTSLLGQSYSFKANVEKRHPPLVNIPLDAAGQEYIGTLASMAEKRTGLKCNLRYESGSSDMKWTSEKGIVSVVFGPKGGDYHGNTEFVYLRSLSMYGEIIHDFLSNLGFVA